MTDDIDEQIAQAQAALEDTRFTTYWLDSLEAVDDEPPLQHNDQCDLLGGCPRMA